MAKGGRKRQKQERNAREGLAQHGMRKMKKKFLYVFLSALSPVLDISGRVEFTSLAYSIGFVFLSIDVGYGWIPITVNREAVIKIVKDKLIICADGITTTTTFYSL